VTILDFEHLPNIFEHLPCSFDFFEDEHNSAKYFLWVG